MRLRFALATLSVTAVAIMLFAVPLAFVLEQLVDQNALLRLERRAVLDASAVPSQFATQPIPVQLPAPPPGIRIGLYDDGGHLVAGDGPATADAVTLAALRNDIQSAETEDAFVVAAPVFNDEQIIGAIHAEQDNTAIERDAYAVAGLIAALATAVFGAGGALAMVVARRLTRPVRALTAAVVDLGHGRFDVDPPSSGVAELDTAGDALRSTAQRLKALVAREQAFSTDASHQLRTPLAGMRAAIETELAFPRTDPSVVLNDCLADIDRLDATITRLLSLARATNPATEIDVAPVLDSAVLDWQARFSIAGRPLRLDRPELLPVALGDPAALRTALDVLLDNALVHGAGETRLVAAGTGAAVTVAVGDEGSGFDLPAHEATGEPRHGMGLPLAERLVASMSGRLVISHHGPRPRVSIVLRRSDRQVAWADTPDSQQVAR